MKHKCENLVTHIYARSTPFQINEDPMEIFVVIKAGCFSEQNLCNNVAGLVHTSGHVKVKSELRNMCKKIISEP